MLQFIALFLLHYSRDSFMFLLFCILAVMAFLLLGAASMRNNVRRNASRAKMNALRNAASFDLLQIIKAYRVFITVNETNFTPHTFKRLREATERRIAGTQDGALRLLDLLPVNNDTLLLLVQCKHDVPYIPNGGETFSVTHRYYHFCTVQLKPETHKLVLNMEPALYDDTNSTAYSIHLEKQAAALLQELQNELKQQTRL